MSIRVNLETRAGFGEASVSDTGIGSAPQDMPRVFDRFWRAHKPRAPEQGGAGLGLYVAKWNVDTYAAPSLPEELGKGICVHYPGTLGRQLDARYLS
jgi:signal transduction histidine kinase